MDFNLPPGCTLADIDARMGDPVYEDYCEGCNQGLYPDEVNRVDGEPYCDDCAKRCNGCDEYYRVKDLDEDGMCESCREVGDD